MAENIEFKAKIEDYPSVYKSVCQLTKATPTILMQEDIFYKTRFGRLKLRSICNTEHELIFYRRPDKAGPKCSKYIRIRVNNQPFVDSILARIFGRLVVIKKQRDLFLRNNVRFHLDSVDGLGAFLEIEYILSPSESYEIALDFVNKLIYKLQIPKKSLVDCSYAELMLSKFAE